MSLPRVAAVWSPGLDGVRVSVGLEEGADGSAMVHALSLPGCAAVGETRDEALERFAPELGRWLQVLEAFGESTPPADAELEIAVDEWVRTEGRPAEGETLALFDADRVPLSREEVGLALRRLGDLRGQLLARVRRRPDADLDAPVPGGSSVRATLEALARAQWWTLSRLGASPLAALPTRTLGRLDTAMALVIHAFSGLTGPAAAAELEIEGEVWTPRKVLRRLLWLEWTLGGVTLAALASTETTP